MGVSGGPYIVRDSSLILELDAADRNSYVSGSSTWRDLTANNNSGTLTNSPGYSSTNLGNIVFDGVNDYINCGVLPITSFGTSEFSVSFMINPVIWSTLNVYGIVDCKTNDTTNGWSIYHDGYAGINKINARLGLTNNFTNNTNIKINQWNGLTFTRTNSGTINWYYNGIIDGQSTNTVNLIDTQALSIGYAKTWGGYFNGNISNVQIYNRALSAAEILQNYNQLKSRFNL